MENRKCSQIIYNRDYPIVQTEKGKLHGLCEDGVFNFRGIQYASAGRFQLPVPIEPWEGVKEAVNYAQGSANLNACTLLANPFPVPEVILPYRNFWQGENCQNLNVWTKSLDKSKKRPVMVWFHGGGFSGGSATQLHAYDGWELANTYDVVVVTVNNRLNMLGFFDLSDYGEKYKYSRNLGIADMIEALKWIQSNIACFGGDPDNVMIYGQSGGGGKVTTLLQSPAARGLFHKAAIQSGISGGNELIQKSTKELANATVEILGLTKDTIEKIETIELEALYQATQKACVNLGIPGWEGAYGPTPDDFYFIGYPQIVGFYSETKNIPILIGSNIVEFPGTSMCGKGEWTEEETLRAAQKQYGEGAEEIIKAFEKAYPEMNPGFSIDVDTYFRTGVTDFIKLRHASGSAPVYQYVFNYVSEFMNGLMFGHSMEIQFAFHNALYSGAVYIPEVTERVQDEMSGAWANFAYSGNPNHNKMPIWEPYTEENGACMIFGNETHLAYHHDEELIDAVKQYNRIKGRFC